MSEMAIADIGDFPAMPRPEQIEEAVSGQLDELDAPQEQEGRWSISDEGSADWALRKLTKIRAKTATVNAQADRQVAAIHEAVQPYIEPIEEWRTEQTEKLAKEVQHWEAVLIEYHRSLLAEDDKAISVELPHGVLKSRKSPDKWEFDDEKFLAWASVHAPELVRVKEEPDKPLAKKSLKVIEEGAVTAPGVDGLVPGVLVTAGERRFEVSTEVAQ